MREGIRETVEHRERVIRTEPREPYAVGDPVAARCALDIAALASVAQNQQVVARIFGPKRERERLDQPRKVLLRDEASGGHEISLRQRALRAQRPVLPP